MNNSVTKVIFADFMATITGGGEAVSHSKQRNIQSQEVSADTPDPLRVCSDGERTQYLTRLAGMYIGKGYNINEVITLVRDWNSRNDPPLEDQKIISTCFSIQDSHLRNHVSQIIPAEITPLFDLSSAGVGQYLDKDPPVRRWLLKDCMPAGKVGMVVAKGGTGKSQLMLQMAISVATGEDLAGVWQIGEMGAVLALFAEDDEEEIHRRLCTCANAMAPTVTDAVKYYKDLSTNLFVKSMVAENNLMTNAIKGAEVTQTDYIRRLLLTVEGLQNLKLIIIDPASRFRGGDENASQDVTRFVEALEALAKATGAAVLVVHHMNKGSANSPEQSQDASRGSSALTDGVRWQMNLATFTAAEAKTSGIQDEERGFYLTATVTKNNYAPPQPKALFKRGDGGYLHMVELTSTKEVKTQDLKAKIVQLVTDEIKAGRTYSRTAFENAFGAEEGLLKVGKITVRKALIELVSTKRLSDEKKKLGLPKKAKLMVTPT